MKGHGMKLATSIVGLMLAFGSPSWAGNCSDMAAFNTQIKDFMETESVSDTLKADVKQLATECETLHGAGKSVDSISSCNDALKLIMVN